MLYALSKFPFEAKQTFWGMKEEAKSLEVQTCMGRMLSLVSYYFTGNNATTIAEDPTYRVVQKNFCMSEFSCPLSAH